MGANIDKLKGKIKKVEGELTGDKVRQGQGWVEEKKGEAEAAIDRVKDRVDEKIHENKDADSDVENDNSSRR